MSKGLKEGELNGRDVYPDIIDHPHWQSPTRPRMSLYDRAAQFSSFDALAGYSDMIREEQRLVDQKMELSETELELLNQKLNLIAAKIRTGEQPVITVTFFEADPLKAGGSYRTATEKIKKVDAIRGRLILARTEGYGRTNAEIPIADLLELSGDFFSDAEKEESR